MRTMAIATAGVFLSLTSSCGGTSEPIPASSDAINQFQQLAAQAQSAATAYGGSMMGVTNVSECRAVHDEYDGRIRPWLSQMMATSRGMDDFMRGHGGATVADMSCVSTAMMTELDHHDSAACTLSDLDADRGETSRHVTLMKKYAGHLWSRCSQMTGIFDGGSFSWEGMMDGCEGWGGGGMGGMMPGGHSGRGMMP